MKFNKRGLIFLIFSIFLISSFLISCDNKIDSELINLKLTFSSKAKTNKNISPSEDELTVFKFIVNGVGPNGKTFNLETSEQSTELSNLIKGKWNISVTGYNINDEAIVEGSGDYYLFNSSSKVNISLDYLTGNGDITLDLYWNTEQADPSMTGVITTYYRLEDNNLNEYSITDSISYPEDGHAIVTTPLPCGNYIFSTQLYCGSTELAGFAQQLRVLANHTTLGTNSFLIGDTTIDYGISFTCNTYLPINGVINSAPQSIIEGQEITLTFSPTEIPQGYEESQIRYCWYFEGTLIENETSNSLTILPVKGQHRYDLLAYIDGMSGTAGSTKIIVTCQEE